MDSSENKVYVDVTVEFDRFGRMLPKTIRWEDSRVYTVDKVLDMRPSYSQKSGGQGDLYLIRVQGKEGHLFFERNAESFSGSVGKWFVARS